MLSTSHLLCHLPPQRSSLSVSDCLQRKHQHRVIFEARCLLCFLFTNNVSVHLSPSPAALLSLQSSLTPYYVVVVLFCFVFLIKCSLVVVSSSTFNLVPSIFISIWPFSVCLFLFLSSSFHYYHKLSSLRSLSSLSYHLPLCSYSTLFSFPFAQLV